MTRRAMTLSSEVNVQLGKKDSFLAVDVFSDINRLLWTTILVQIFEHEERLDNGRFTHFEFSTQAHRVDIMLENENESWIDLVTPMINWIAEHVECQWNLEIDVRELNQPYMFRFSFADVPLAVMFKLLFA